jgi:hypothetical protein
VNTKATFLGLECTDSFLVQEIQDCPAEVTIPVSSLETTH